MSASHSTPILSKQKPRVCAIPAQRLVLWLQVAEVAVERLHLVVKWPFCVCGGDILIFFNELEPDRLGLLRVCRGSVTFDDGARSRSQQIAANLVVLDVCCKSTPISDMHGSD